SQRPCWPYRTRRQRRALAFGELIAFGFDSGNDLALDHGGAESRHEDLPDLRSNSQDSLPWVFGGKGRGRK
ncbi:hypothetical protein FCV25MIE_19915, partial [Fagus crenata]